MAGLHCNAPLRSELDDRHRRDVRVLATVWFGHDAHESLKEFITHWPLVSAEFRAHDR